MQKPSALWLCTGFCQHAPVSTTQAAQALFYDKGERNWAVQVWGVKCLDYNRMSSHAGELHLDCESVYEAIHEATLQHKIYWMQLGYCPFMWFPGSVRFLCVAGCHLTFRAPHTFAFIAITAW